MVGLTLIGTVQPTPDAKPWSFGMARLTFIKPSKYQQEGIVFRYNRITVLEITPEKHTTTTHVDLKTSQASCMQVKPRKNW